MTRDKKFLVGAIAFTLGIFLFPFVKVEVWILFLAAGGIVAFLFLSPGEKYRILFLFILCFIVGMLRFSFCEKLSDVDAALQELNGKKVSFECTVAKMPEYKNGKQQITLSSESEDFPHGKILAYMSAYGDYNFGDKVKFEGTLKVPSNPEGFDYRKYLFLKNIYLISYYPKLEKVAEDENSVFAAIYSWRKRANANITKILPSPQGNILSAMTLGMNSDEIKGVMDNFNKTGTSHIIVVSGSHLVIIIAILMAIFLGVGINRNKLFYLIALGITGFVVLSGSGSSAVRAVIMALVFLFGVKVSRANHALNALLFSATLMIFINPYILAGDVSFQLSFLATFGIIHIYPALQKRFEKAPQWGGTKDVLLATFAAQVATLPIIVMNFGQFSLLSFLANMLILPTVPFLMIGGFLLVAVSFVNLTLAQIISWPLYMVLAYQLAIVNFLSNTDFGLIKF